MLEITNRNKEKWIATGILFLPAIFQFFPMLYLFSLSLKSAEEIIQYPPHLLPKTITLSNYIKALDSAPLFRFLWNSFFVATLITLFQIITSILAAYALARLEFRGKKIIFILLIATMMIPGEVTIIPNYFTLAKWDALNTYAGLILPFSASGFGIFLLYTFFRSIPKELEEAVIVDGGSSLRFLFQFVVPLSFPAILAFGIYAFVSAWNQYLWPLILTTSTEMQTAQIGIGIFRAQNESISWGVIMAATTILISPTIALFLFTQKQFVEGITYSGVKG